MLAMGLPDGFASGIVINGGPAAVTNQVIHKAAHSQGDIPSLNMAILDGASTPPPPVWMCCN
jgi:hypothetical protein